MRGADYQWQVTYPGPDGALGTRDDVTGRRDLHLPSDTPVEIALESEDFVYVFRIPDFGVNEAAVPELQFSAAFRAGGPGRHLLKGDQMCGFRHEGLLGQVVVHTPSGFRDWLASAGP